MSRLLDGKLWASKLPESPYNTPPDSGSDFEAFTTESAFYDLPTIDKTSDEGQMGAGSAYPTHYCNDYWSQPGWSLATRLAFFEIYGRFWLRAFGGPVTDAAAGTGYRHSAKQQTQADGNQLPGTSFIFQNLPTNVLETGFVVAQAALTKGRQDPRPSLSFAFVGTGNHVQPQALTGLPGLPTNQVCPKSGIIIKYTDPDSVVVDLGALGCSFVNVGVSLQNNLILGDRCPSDPELTMPVTDGGTANVLTRVLRGDQRLNVAFTMLIKDVNPEYVTMLQNQQCTNLTVAVKGPVIGAGPQTYEIGTVIPKFYLVAAAPTDDNGNAAYSITAEPVVTDSPADLPYGYVINDTASDYK